MASLTELLDIAQAASRMLQPLLHAGPADLMAALMPHEADYDTVFLPVAAGNARIGYEPLWKAVPKLGRPDQTEVDAIAVHAETLRGDSAFPGGYKKIAHLLQPGLVWVAFKVHAPGQAGLSYDGLVWLDGRWAWFPKPYRVIDEVVS